MPGEDEKNLEKIVHQDRDNSLKLSETFAIPQKEGQSEEEIEKVKEEIEKENKRKKKEIKNTKIKRIIDRSVKIGSISLGMLALWLATGAIYEGVTKKSQWWSKPGGDLFIKYLSKGIIPNPLSDKDEKKILEQDGFENIDILVKYDLDRVQALKGKVSENLIPRLLEQYSEKGLEDLSKKISYEDLARINLSEEKLNEKITELEENDITEFSAFIRKNYNLSLIDRLKKQLDPGTKEEYESEYSNEEVEEHIKYVKEENIKIINRLIKHYMPYTIEQVLDDFKRNEKNPANIKITLETLNSLIYGEEKDLDSKVRKLRSYLEEHKDISMIEALRLIDSGVHSEFYEEYVKITKELSELNEEFTIGLMQFKNHQDYLKNEHTSKLIKTIAEQIEHSSNSCRTFEKLIKLKEKFGIKFVEENEKFLNEIIEKSKNETYTCFDEILKMKLEFFKENKKLLLDVLEKYERHTPYIYEFINKRGLNFFQKNEDFLLSLKKNINKSMTLGLLYHGMNNMSNLYIEKNKEFLKTIVENAKSNANFAFYELNEIIEEKGEKYIEERKESIETLCKLAGTETSDALKLYQKLPENRKDKTIKLLQKLNKILDKKYGALLREIADMKKELIENNFEVVEDVIDKFKEHYQQIIRFINKNGVEEYKNNISFFDKFYDEQEKDHRYYLMNIITDNGIDFFEKNKSLINCIKENCENYEGPLFFDLNEFIKRKGKEFVSDKREFLEKMIKITGKFTSVALEIYEKIDKKYEENLLSLFEKVNETYKFDIYDTYLALNNLDKDILEKKSKLLEEIIDKNKQNAYLRIKELNQKGIEGFERIIKLRKDLEKEYCEESVRHLLNMIDSSKDKFFQENKEFFDILDKLERKLSLEEVFSRPYMNFSKLIEKFGKEYLSRNKDFFMEAIEKSDDIQKLFSELCYAKTDILKDDKEYFRQILNETNENYHSAFRVVISKGKEYFDKHKDLIYNIISNDKKRTLRNLLSLENEFVEKYEDILKNISNNQKFSFLDFEELKKLEEKFGKKFFEDNSDLIKTVSENKDSFLYPVFKTLGKLDKIFIEENKEILLCCAKNIKNSNSIYYKLNSIYKNQGSEYFDEQKELFTEIVKNLDWPEYALNKIIETDKDFLNKNKEIIIKLIKNSDNRFNATFKELKEMKQEFIDKNKTLLEDISNTYEKLTDSIYIILKEKGINFYTENKDLLELIKTNGKEKERDPIQNPFFTSVIFSVIEKFDETKLKENKELMKELSNTYKNHAIGFYSIILTHGKKFLDENKEFLEYIKEKDKECYSLVYFSLSELSEGFIQKNIEWLKNLYEIKELEVESIYFGIAKINKNFGEDFFYKNKEFIDDLIEDVGKNSCTALEEIGKMKKEFVTENIDYLSKLGKEFKTDSHEIYSLIRKKGKEFIDENKDLIYAIKESECEYKWKLYRNLYEMKSEFIEENKETLKIIIKEHKEKASQIYSELSDHPERITDYIKPK